MIDFSTQVVARRHLVEEATRRPPPTAPPRRPERSWPRRAAGRRRCRSVSGAPGAPRPAGCPGRRRRRRRGCRAEVVRRGDAGRHLCGQRGHLRVEVAAALRVVRAVRPHVPAVEGGEGVLTGADAVGEVAPSRPDGRVRLQPPAAPGTPGRRTAAGGRVRSRAYVPDGLVEDPDRRPGPGAGGAWRPGRCRPHAPPRPGCERHRPGRRRTPSSIRPRRSPPSSGGRSTSHIRS